MGTGDYLVDQFRAVYREDQSDPEKQDLLASLVRLFSTLASQEEFTLSYPEFFSLFTGFRDHVVQGKGESLEEDLTGIYCYLHGTDSSYAPADRREFEKYGGYWCHAGGLSPLIRARSFITQETRLADYGAGNGLQGLLFQYLYPHRQTCQIELSLSMIEKGKRLQTLMGIPVHRVEWMHQNVMDVPPDRFDFIYIYRPVRPEGRGREFYTRFARTLDRLQHRIIIFSIADCLKDFLGSSFKVFFSDGHLTCFTNERLHEARPGA